MEQNLLNDTITAISTPQGSGGIAVIRISGSQAISIVNQAWEGADLLAVPSHTVHLGKYFSIDGNLIDEAVATIFISPRSFTGEDTVEISVHGSPWIQREILNDLVKRGVRIAEPGEFTKRAFFNGKIDLTQAEGIADLIASSSKAAHDLAISQTRGYFSKEFNLLREKLIEFASLLELELDFSEEDIEFADRSALFTLCKEIKDKVDSLASSYSRGAVLKNGVPVVIAGMTNAGKSSLLNLLLEDDKAIVTDIPGTTRDIIEDTTEINGILYRFIDTAGLRNTEDVVEEIGIKRAISALEKAFIVVWMIDLSSSVDLQLNELQKYRETSSNPRLIILLNKSDLQSRDSANYNLLSYFKQLKVYPEFSDLQAKDSDTSHLFSQFLKLNITPESIIPFSTKTRQGLPELLSGLHKLSSEGQNPEKDLIVTNSRHYEILTRASESLARALENLRNEIPGDLVAQDIREAISHLSTLTGSITSDTLLHSIFSRFCIGK